MRPGFQNSANDEQYIVLFTCVFILIFLGAAETSSVSKLRGQSTSLNQPNQTKYFISFRRASTLFFSLSFFFVKAQSNSGPHQYFVDRIPDQRCSKNNFSVIFCAERAEPTYFFSARGWVTLLFSTSVLSRHENRQWNFKLSRKGNYLYRAVWKPNNLYWAVQDRY